MPIMRPLRPMPPSYSDVCDLFDEIFDQCDNVNGLTERILATHPEGFDDSARKVYNAALILANQKIKERIQHVEGLDSAVLTMTNCKEKVEHECNKIRFIIGGLVLTLRGRVCIKPDAMKQFVLKHQASRFKMPGNEKTKQNSGARAQEAKYRRSLTPSELWVRVSAPGKGEEDKLKTMWQRMKKHDKRILFIIVFVSNINDMVFEVLSGPPRVDEEKKLADALVEANDKIVEAVKGVEGIKSVVLSFVEAKEGDSPEGHHLVQIGTEGKDRVCGVYILICGDKAKAIQFAIDLTDVAIGGEEAHQQRQSDHQKGFKQEMTGWSSAGSSVVQEGPKLEEVKQQEGIERDPGKQIRWKPLEMALSLAAVKQKTMKTENAKQESD